MSYEEAIEELKKDIQECSDLINLADPKQDLHDKLQNLKKDLYKILTRKKRDFKEEQAQKE